MPISLFARSGKVDGKLGLCFYPDRVTAARIEHRSGDALKTLECFDWPAVSLKSNDLLQRVRNSRLSGASCVLTLPKMHYSLLQIDKPAVPDEELISAARWKIKDLLDYPVDEAIIDAFEVPGLESRGKPPVLYVAAAKKSLLAGYVSAIAAAGLQLEKINIEDLALRNFVSGIANESESIALLHLAQSGSGVSVIRDKTLFLSRNFDFDINDLEAMNRPSTSAVAGFTMSIEREKFENRVALEVQRTLDYFDRQFARPPVKRLIVTVTNQRLPAASVTALREALGLEVLAPDLTQQFGSDQKNSVDMLGNCMLAICGAFDEASL